MPAVGGEAGVCSLLTLTAEALLVLPALRNSFGPLAFASSLTNSKFLDSEMTLMPWALKPKREGFV